MKPIRSLPPSLPRKVLHSMTFSAADRRLGLDREDGVQALVVPGAVDVHSHGLAVPRHRVAVRAGVEARHHHAALRLGHVAQPPGDERHELRVQGLDDALLPLGGHQRNVPVEDGRADGVGRGPDRDLPARHGAPPRLVAVAGDREDRVLPGRALLDRLPGRGVRSPGVRRGLLGRQPGRLVRRPHGPRVDLPDLRRLTPRRRVQGRRRRLRRSSRRRSTPGRAGWRRATGTSGGGNSGGKTEPSRG